MSKCCGYEVHPAAELFPLLPEDELKELAEDIKKNGLIYPVTMCDKKVLDGRNRLLACELANIVAQLRDYKTYNSEHTPTEWVLATNSKRRQLTPSQRAAIAAEATPLIAEEVEQVRRQKISESRNGEMGATIPPSQKESRRARSKAAKAVGASSRYVSDAAKIKAEAPEVFEQVKAGTKTVSAATKELGRGHKPRPKPDNVSILLAVWKKCNNQQKTAFVEATPVAKWLRQHR